MAVTENKLIKQAEGCKVSIPVAASTRLYQGTLAFITPTGYLDDDTGFGANVFAGVVVGETDNSSGSAGDLKAEVLREGEFELVGTFTQASVGLAAYATDNYTVTVTPTTANSVRIGVVSRYISSTLAMVAIDSDDGPNQVVKGVTLTATDASRAVMIATRSMRLKAVREVHGVASSSGTLNIEKLTGTTAPGSGTAMLTGTISLAGTANTVLSGTLSATAADLVLAPGDRVGIVIAGTMTNLVGGIAELLFEFI